MSRLQLVEDGRCILPGQFIFQQDGAPAHTAALAQNWIGRNCPDFIWKNEWPPNSPDLNPLDFHVWGAMLELYQHYTPKPSNTAELKNVLQVIWADLLQEPIDASILSFRKRLSACIKADGGHFEHCCWTLWLTIEYVICSLSTFTWAGSFACICDAAIATFMLVELQNRTFKLRQP